MDDKTILSINSPQNSVQGPYAVICKNITQRWAIVAMEWEKGAVLGIRWFSSKIGIPYTSHESTQHPIWFIIPSELYKSILSGLPFSHADSAIIDNFLSLKDANREEAIQAVKRIKPIVLGAE